MIEQVVGRGSAEVLALRDPGGVAGGVVLASLRRAPGPRDVSTRERILARGGRRGPAALAGHGRPDRSACIEPVIGALLLGGVVMGAG